MENHSKEGRRPVTKAETRSARKTARSRFDVVAQHTCSEVQKQKRKPPRTGKGVAVWSVLGGTAEGGEGMGTEGLRRRPGKWRLCRNERNDNQRTEGGESSPIGKKENAMLFLKTTRFVGGAAKDGTPHVAAAAEE